MTTTNATFPLRGLAALALAGLMLMGIGCREGDSGEPAGEPAAAPIPAAEQETEADDWVFANSGPGDCSHRYYPLREGYSIRYSHTDPQGGSMEYDMVVVESTGSGAVMEYRFFEPAPITMAQNLTCEGGRISAEGYMNMGDAFGEGGGVEFSTIAVEGSVMPSDLKVGQEWSVTYETLARMGGENLPPGMPSSFNSRITVENEVLASEKVSVAAGTFDALKVRSVTTTSMDVPGMPVPMDPVVVTSTQWWVEGVGLVRNDTMGGVTEAVEVDLP